MHPRNRHQGHYDFPLLIKACPELARFAEKTPYGQVSIDFANPEAVKTLNRALLIHYYGIQDWDIPPGYLCPPIPGRSDYVHTVADLLCERNDHEIPQGSEIRGLDIGVGSNCIYPIIGHGEYGWSFVGTDTDQAALASAERILKANPNLARSVELRIQISKTSFFKNIVKEDERFHFSICNPPFHASPEEAAAGTRRKWENLGRERTTKLNFGGQSTELWYPGGEIAFVKKMIEESRQFSEKILWFTTLISKETKLPAIENALLKCKTTDYRSIPMDQGQKKSRVVAWTFV